MPENERATAGRPSPLVSTGPGGNLDLDEVFTYHAPFGDQVGRYEEIRSYGKDLATAIATDCPSSPERTTAINKVREAVMWANAAIAIHEKNPATTCSCQYGFVQAEGVDPDCPVHGTPEVHWTENGAMVHPGRGVTTDDPSKVTCDVCKTHLREDPMPS